MTGRGDLWDLLLFVVGAVFVLGVLTCAICAVLALRYYAETRGARLRARRGRARALSPHVPLQPMRDDLFGDLSWEHGETELDRARSRREARESEHSGC